jgi:hypothetical protein
VLSGLPGETGGSPDGQRLLGEVQSDRMLQLLALPLLLASFGAEREISTPLTGPNPGGTGIYQLLPRPGGGFTALYQDGRGYELLFDQETVGLRLARLSSTLQLQDPTGIPLPLPLSTWQIAALQERTLPDR